MRMSTWRLRDKGLEPGSNDSQIDRPSFLRTCHDRDEGRCSALNERSGAIDPTLGDRYDFVVGTREAEPGKRERRKKVLFGSSDCTNVRPSLRRPCHAAE